MSELRDVAYGNDALQKKWIYMFPISPITP